MGVASSFDRAVGPKSASGKPGATIPFAITPVTRRARNSHEREVADLSTCLRPRPGQWL